MSVSINISNDIRQLANAFISGIDQAKGDVFRPVYAVVQTQGMEHWLKYRMAEQLGIAANVKYLSPSEIVWKVYQFLGGNYINKIDRQDLDWLIFSIIGSTTFKKAFPTKAAYFLQEDKSIDAIKQWELAAKLADLFDQYQIYRSPVIIDWNYKDLSQLAPEQRWQAFVWKELKVKTEKNVLDITEVQSFILEQLKNPEACSVLKDRMPALFLFGLSIITTFHLKIFYALGAHVDIHWFIGNPAPEVYWFDDESEENIFRKRIQGKKINHINQGNALLTNWAKVLQSTFRMIFMADEFINAIDDLPATIPSGKTLLGALQADMFHNNMVASSFSKEQIEDKSLTLVSTYSKRREVETVYNFILNAVLSNTYGALKERDFIVMVTDVNAYAPYIRAVMDNAPYRFDYTIADERISNGDTIITALIKILELSESRFAAEAVLQLLHSKFIKTKFGISDVDLIRNTIAKAGIRFGFENDYEHNVDDTYLVSWRYGLKRIMWGLCIADEVKVQEEKAFYPVAAADGFSEMKELIGFVSLVEALESSIKQRHQAKSLRHWSSYIEDLLNTFLLVDEDEETLPEISLIKKLLPEEQISDILKNELIGYEVFKKRLTDNLNNEVVQGRFLNRGITFCSPLPFRSIPFKVVAMLGLNHDAFPRREQHLDFDLMAKSPMLGDRNIRENDKHLFLESLLSAESALYLSYIGCSIKDNSKLPPSILVDELLDYIQEGAGSVDVRDLLIQVHPLHSYSIRYNQNNSDLLPNYFIRNAQAWPLKPEVKDLSPSKLQSQEYNLDAVWKFFNKPSSYYFNNVLKVYFDKGADQIADTELFDLDGLAQWKLNDTVMRSLVNAHLDQAIDELYLKGNLPLKNVGCQWLLETKETFKGTSDKFESIFGTRAERSQLNLQYVFKGFSYKGSLAEIYDGRLLGLGFYNGTTKEKLIKKMNQSKAQLALRYLFAQACSANLDGAVLIFNAEHFELKPIVQSEAKLALERILDVFLNLHQGSNIYGMEIYGEEINAGNFVSVVTKKLESARDYERYLNIAGKQFDLQEQVHSFKAIQSIIKDILIGIYHD